MNEKRWSKNWWLWRGFDKPSLWFRKRRFRIITNRCSTPGSGMISTTRGAKQPLILTIVYGRNESSRRNYSRRATNSDEMIMIIGCHKFPFLLDPSPLLGSRPPLVAPRCHLCDRTLRIDLANFYNYRCRWLDSPFRDEEDFYRWRNCWVSWNRWLPLSAVSRLVARLIDRSNRKIGAGLKNGRTRREAKFCVGGNGNRRFVVINRWEGKGGRDARVARAKWKIEITTGFPSRRESRWHERSNRRRVRIRNRVDISHEGNTVRVFVAPPPLSPSVSHFDRLSRARQCMYTGGPPVPPPRRLRRFRACQLS